MKPEQRALTCLNVGQENPGKLSYAFGTDKVMQPTELPLIL